MSINSKNWILPVWVVAAAKAATELLMDGSFNSVQHLVEEKHKERIVVPVKSAALLANGKKALAITSCNSSNSIDLTRGLEVWVCVELNLQEYTRDKWLQIIPGQGVGTMSSTGEACLSQFTFELFNLNLRSLVPNKHCLKVEVVIPKGKELAKRTSNEAFGVVNGLALIGTQAEVQISASPEDLKEKLEQLQKISSSTSFSGFLTFVIGQNGLELARQMGLFNQPIIKVGNWVGPLLVAAAELGIKELLLFGYHGKLIKLAGGVFHTHHHLADARIEILTALAVKEELPLELITLLSSASSIEEALNLLESNNKELARDLWLRIASNVEERSSKYISNYGSWSISIGAALFDKRRILRSAGPKGIDQLSRLKVSLQDSG